ncbi:hypothetical protein JCM3774_004084 [Rhodotorula dairenensis]
MLVWLLKLILLSLNIRASHKALAPVPAKRDRSGARPASSGSSSRGERARRRQIREEVVNWTVLTMFVAAEKLADRTVGRVLPLYGTAKLVVLLLLLGSHQIYDKLVAPIIRPYERPLDLVGFVANEILDILLAVLLFVPKLVARKIKNRQSTQDVPAILRGLRQPHHPRLAASLADSIERSQGDTNAISARFSQPVHVRLQPVPFKPRRATPSVNSSSSTRTPATQSSARVPATSHEPRLPPPPAASTAPFRPVPVIKDARIPRASVQQGHEPSDTLRHSGHSDPRGSKPVASIYPSLADVSTPLSTPRAANRPTPEASASIGQSPSDTEAPDDLPRGTRAKRRRSSPSRTEQEPTILDSLTATSSRPPSLSPTSTYTGPPPTPAPPGAFRFISPVKPTGPVSHGASDAGSSTGQADVRMEDTEDGTPRRSSSRHGNATPRAGTSTDLPSRTRASSRRSGALVDVVEQQESSRASRQKRPSSSSGATTPTPERPAKRSARSAQEPQGAAGTPRQRALGAIAQLSKDLLSDEFGQEEQTLALAGRKKAGKGVLGRSTRTAAAAPAPVHRTARGRARAPAVDTGDLVDGELAGSAQVATVAKKLSPRKRKASEEADSDRSEPRLAKKSGAPERRVAQAGSSGIPKPVSSTSRSTLSTSASSLLPGAQEAATQSSLPLATKTRRITAETTSSSAVPPRRARRVLLGRAGPGAAEEEEEIDGVPVVTRRRRKQLYCSRECQKEGWKAHKAACAAHKKGHQYIAHFDLGAETTKHSPWCAPLIDKLSNSQTHTVYVVESLEAMEEVYNHPLRPSAIFCSSGDFTKRGQRKLWTATRAYVEEGGRFVIGGPGANHMRMDAIDEMLAGLGLPWKMLGYMRTTHYRNDQNPLLAALPPTAAARTLLPESYSMKSITLKGVADRDALYRSTDESQVESLAMALGGGKMNGGKVAVAATQVGKGSVSWVGDVGQEDGSTRTVCFLLGLAEYR